MKRIFLLMAIIALVFVSCDNGSGGNSTTFRIQNESFSEITHVVWNGTSFTFGEGSITISSSSTQNVTAGSGHIYFRRKINPIYVRTQEVFTVQEGEQKDITINNNTVVVDVDNPADTGTLGSLKVKPQITISQNNSIIPIYGEYDFGTVRKGTTKDITFTIENSGRADLNFNVVGGNVINLTENTSAFFSVTQQPFATMSIPGGGSTNFILRYSPTAAGINFNAVVGVSTNSEDNAEFYFRIKGNGTNVYQIGETGPGGGMVFYAQGGQYKEVSGDLGIANYDEAVNLAKNFKGGGFTNWALPSTNELELIYQNLHRENLGGFYSSTYWSFTEGDGYYKWCINFNTGSWSQLYYNTFSIRVLAVRSFNN